MVATAFFGALLFKLQYDYRTKTEDKEPEKIYSGYYAYISESEDDEFYKEAFQSAQKAGEKTDVCVEDFASELKTRYSAAERIRLAVWSGVDGIIAEGKSASFKNALKEAEDAGIPVVLIGNDDVETGRVSFVGASGYNIGLLYGRQASELSKKILNNQDYVSVLILSTQEDSSTSQDLIINTIQDFLTKDEDLNRRLSIRTVGVSSSATFVSQEEVMNILLDSQKNDDVPDVVIALTSELTNSAYQGIIDLNLTRQCNIIGYYASDSIREAIKNESIYSSVVTDASEMGLYSVQALNEYLDSGYVSEYYAVSSSVLTKDDISKAKGGGK